MLVWERNVGFCWCPFYFFGVYTKSFWLGKEFPWVCRGCSNEFGPCSPSKILSYHLKRSPTSTIYGVRFIIHPELITLAIMSLPSDTFPPQFDGGGASSTSGGVSWTVMMGDPLPCQPTDKNHCCNSRCQQCSFTTWRMRPHWGRRGRFLCEICANLSLLVRRKAHLTMNKTYCILYRSRYVW